MERTDRYAAGLSLSPALRQQPAGKPPGKHGTPGRAHAAHALLRALCERCAAARSPRAPCTRDGGGAPLLLRRRD